MVQGFGGFLLVLWVCSLRVCDLGLFGCVDLRRFGDFGFLMLWLGFYLLVNWCNMGKPAILWFSLVVCVLGWVSVFWSFCGF